LVDLQFDTLHYEGYNPIAIRTHYSHISDPKIFPGRLIKLPTCNTPKHMDGNQDVFCGAIVIISLVNSPLKYNWPSKIKSCGPLTDMPCL